ncbi:MtrAB system histidine kinase MtrB [Janibacter sp. G56]|uniref:MtrAB system histidine kinase MtrB n=1 Tax=Janibacter sp. G56 TaxID=3418717 RepID=UPI003D082647
MSEPAGPADSPDESASAPTSTVGASWRRVLEGIEGAWASFVRRWRRSLQLRIVSTTLVLGLIVTGLVGSYMYREIARGLQSDRVASAQAEARELAAEAQQNFDTTTAGTDEAALNAFAEELVRTKLTPPRADTSRYVILAASINNTSAPVRLNTVLPRDVPLEAVPDELRTAVAADADRQQSTLTEISHPADSDADVVAGGEATDTIPAVIVGQQVQVPTAGAYDLYFIYPMDRERQTLGVVSRSLLLGVLFLTTLVSAVAWFVTRQVVSPVRRAAAVAGRLSSGHLNERMPARGSDDLAALGKAFNEMADNLQSQIRQLEGLSRVQQRFVSDVSHELRTPLTTITMAGDLIHASRADFPPAVGRAAELLHIEIERFEVLLTDLLEISRFDAGAAIIEQEDTDLSEIVRRVVVATQAIADARGSEVTVHAPLEPVVAAIDPRRVERIVRNLVVNAVEHGEGRPVEIHVARNETAVAVAVRDRGVGLRPGEAGLVFNRFWRADSSRARTTGGTGLGLAISLEDARLHGGWLQAWGEPGRGSCFRLTLPRERGGEIRESPLPLAPTDGSLTEAST